MLSLRHSDALTDLSNREIHVTEADVVTWQGRRALHLVNGLALLPGELSGDLTVSVRAGTDGAAYAGIAFYVQGTTHHELLYAQPHTSGLWDALQYDSVMGGSATWQIYHGPAYQQPATVPTGSWFTLQAHIAAGGAEFCVDGQAPLHVAKLAQEQRTGRVGVWTYLPAYFADLALSPLAPGVSPGGGVAPTCPAGTLNHWHLEGVGPVKVEASGIVNVNRYLSWRPGAEAVLSTALVAAHDTEVELGLGYSDELEISLDGELVHSGSNTFRSTGAWEDRGYIAPGTEKVWVAVSAGRHVLGARLRTMEPFGWGLTAALAAEGVAEEA